MKHIIVIPLIILLSLLFVISAMAQGNQNGKQNNNQILKDGIYYIASPKNKQRLFSLSKTGNVKMVDPINDQNQQWVLKYIKDNVYTLQNRSTKGFLEVPFASCKDKKSVQTWNSATEPHQRWEVSIKSNQFVLKPTHCLNKALDRNLGNVDADAIIFDFGNGDNNNQYWDITHINQPEAGTIRIYPNPTREIINVAGLTFKTTLVKVIDSHGKMVFKGMMNRKNNRLNMSSVQRGLYFLTTGTGATKKFVKI